MKARITDTDALLAIEPDVMRAYLVAEGWLTQGPWGQTSEIFLRVGDATELLVPIRRDLGDYASVMSDIIRVLSDVEGRSELQVYGDLITSDKDVIRFALPGSDEDGSIRVSDGAVIVDSVSDLLLSAACSVIRPQAVYQPGKIKKAQEYMSKVRLGQTERGSYIVCLLAPVPPTLAYQEELWPDEALDVFDRRVTRRLMSGLEAALEIKAGFGAGFTSDEVQSLVDSGISANLCLSASQIVDHGDGATISITWARTRPTPIRRWERSISKWQVEGLRELADILIEKQPQRDERLEGFVVNLSRQDSSTGGAVRIHTMIDGKPTTIRTDLGKSDYDLAIMAHAEGKIVSLSGTLERVNQRWKLDRITEFGLATRDNQGP